MADKTFADGFFFRMPSAAAPGYIKGNMSIKVEDFVAFLGKNVKKDGWVNLVVKESQKGTIYAELDNWEPEKKEERNHVAEVEEKYAPKSSDINPDDIPF